MTPALWPGPTIVELAQALRTRETSATELVEQSLRRAHELNPTLNAFVLIDEEGARTAAQTADEELAAGVDRGPLHGIPVAVKDLIDMAGLPTTCGSATSFGSTATDDADIVKRLRHCGAVIVGKTTLHEFAYGATGDRSVHGPSRNPRDPSRMSGGSSGGSAVAVASGIVPLALGTDTAGSVRVPAALCGAVGLKPAYDALPSKGVYPLAPTLDHVGVFAVTIMDAHIGYDALSDRPTGILLDNPAQLSVGWIPPNDIAATDPRIEVLTRDLVGQAGFTLATVQGFPGRQCEQSLFDVFSTLQGSEAFRVHQHHLERDRDLIDPEVLARLNHGQEISTTLYAQANEARNDLRMTVNELLSVHDVLAMPSVPIVAPPVDARSVMVADTNLEVRTALLSLTYPWNMAGVPAMSVPAGEIEGLPASLQLVTAPGNEHLMFAAAQAIQDARLQPSAPR